RPPPLLHLLYPPAPLPPLSPYTTLFRSMLHGLLDHGLPDLLGQHQRARQIGFGEEQDELLAAVAGDDVDLPGGGRQTFGHLDEQDRKSTRLNSSHVANSYAVSCLKKKVF